MSDTTTTTLGDLTPLELLVAARSDLVGLVELARSLADGTNTRSEADVDLYIGAYHGSISSKIAVAESKIEKDLGYTAGREAGLREARVIVRATEAYKNGSIDVVHISDEIVDRADAVKNGTAV